VATFGLALTLTFGCSSDSDNGNNQSNINSGTEISSSSGWDGYPSSSGGGSHSSSSGGGYPSSSSAVLKECDAIFNPANKFCYDGNVYDKCGGNVYSPASEICYGSQVTPAKCNGGDSYNPLTQSCCGSIAILSNSTTQRCTNGVVEAKCENNWYKPGQFCYDGIVYNECFGDIYNPLTQGCIENRLVETKCGSNWYSQATQFCEDNKLFNKCDGMVYPPTTNICVNNVAVPAKCGTESYNPLTQFCGNGTVKNYGTALTDARDGTKYKTTVIGTQTWMAENLNYNVSDSKCYYNTEKNCAIYGRLYDWATAMALPSSCNSSSCASSISSKHQGICPSDWHIPSIADYWDILLEAVGDYSTAGKYLKATSGWNSGNGEDKFGFTALPGGGWIWRTGFYGVGSDGQWWMATEGYSDEDYVALALHMDVSNRVDGPDYHKNSLLSVRCVKD